MILRDICHNPPGQSWRWRREGGMPPTDVREDQDEVMTSEQAQDQIRAAVQSNPQVRAWLDKTLQNKGEIEPVQENQRLKVVLDAVSTKN